MRTRQPNAGSQRLINEIQLARLKLAQAESKWEVADEQAREARRRRKEAKQAARRAKKTARQAKEEFAVAKEAVVALEGRFAAAVERAARIRKLARARRASRSAAARTREKLPPKPDVKIPPVAPKLEVSIPNVVPTESCPPEKPVEGGPTGRLAAPMKKVETCRTLSGRTKAKPAVPMARQGKPMVVPGDAEILQPGTTGILPVGRPPSAPEQPSSSRL